MDTLKSKKITVSFKGQKGSGKVEQKNEGRRGKEKPKQSVLKTYEYHYLKNPNIKRLMANILVNAPLFMNLD